MLIVFGALLLAVAVTLTVLALRSGDPAALLEQRLVSGDIHVDEYRSRVAMVRAIPEAW